MVFSAFPFLKDTNNAPNININYVGLAYLHISCSKEFLVTFGLVLGVKSCNHRSVLRFFADGILTVF